METLNSMLYLLSYNSEVTTHALGVLSSYELSHVIERDVWCKGNIDKFKFYVPEIDEQYSVKTIFLTYHENAYKYFEHERENDIIYLSTIEIVDNPMNVFV